MYSGGYGQMTQISLATSIQPKKWTTAGPPQQARPCSHRPEAKLALGSCHRQQAGCLCSGCLSPPESPPGKRKQNAKSELDVATALLIAAFSNGNWQSPAEEKIRRTGDGREGSGKRHSFGSFGRMTVGGEGESNGGKVKVDCV